MINPVKTKRLALLSPLPLLCWLILAWSLPAIAEKAPEAIEFNLWLQEVEQEALAKGVSNDVIAQAFNGLELDPRVLKFDRHQPEFVQTFEQYLTARVSRDRIKKGNELYQQYEPLLQQIGEHYGVDPRYIVAFWGLESSFGRYQGKYSVIRSLATLAYDPRRSAFFRNELMSALQILQEQHVPLEKFVGGWAGAMGQNQFIPSSFLNYAQDFDGDGRKNIWNNNADVWASIANYLKKNNWQTGQEWGITVKIPENLREQLLQLKPEKLASGCRALRHHTRKLSMKDWRGLQVTQADGSDLPDVDFPVAIVIPEEGQSITYMAYPNFRTILSYNCANKYAVSVGLMADQIKK